MQATAFPLCTPYGRLIEEGIYIMESLDLQNIASAGADEFLFIGLPLKVQGATGSTMDPLAVV